jgi:sec-independent protein translocase protein TatA
MRFKRVYEAFMGFGFGELLIILVIVVVLFGANKLPALGKGLGDAIRSFKDAVNDKPASPPKKDLPPERGEK